jgi:hypothetical protein
MNKASKVALLNRYMDGKDNADAAVLASVFAENAIVTFDIKTPIIQFPDSISGNKNIAKVMFGDFHHLFEQVKSYYLNDDFDSSEQAQECCITAQKWLVSMQERESGNSRFGTGSYDWQFEQVGNEWVVKRLHIVIEAMVSFSDDDGLLVQLQQQLNRYPWAEQTQVFELLRRPSALSEISDYLKAK